MKFNIKVKDKKLIPTKSHTTDAGFDLRAYKFNRISNGKLILMDELVEYKLNAGERILIDTGVAIELEPGWEAQIRPRSGLALKNGITIVNSPGTIDCDFRNYIGVILQNTSKDAVVINQYDRIAQMVIKEVPEIELEVVDELNTTDRNMNGFGSTGKN